MKTNALLIAFAFLLIACSQPDMSITTTIKSSIADNTQVETSDQSKGNLERVSPEEVGWSSEKLDKAMELASEIDSAAVMALYDGKVFLSWGEVDRNFKVHSMRKPFLSALYGIFVERGEIDLDATINDLKIDDIPPRLTSKEKQATVRDLLKSRSGIYHVAAAEAPVMAESRPKRGSHPPDSFFYYNNWDFNALGTIFEQETGAKIFESLKMELADSLGMQDFSLDNCQYFYERHKSQHPAYAFRMSARDLARFGLLYQQNGMWNDKQIIPKEWIAESTTSYSIADEASGQGYGYMWRIAPDSSEIANAVGHPFFFHTGIGVHLLAIVPDLKLVLVHRMNTDEEWEDPGEALGELIVGIINARVSPDEAEAAEGEVADDINQDFQQQLEQNRKNLNIPGMSVAVLHKQKNLFARGFGFADLEKKAPATENTPYHIASLTKPFATALIMQLVEAGKLNLEDKMSGILQDANFSFAGESYNGYSELCKMIEEIGQDESGPFARYRSLFQNYSRNSDILTVKHHLTHTTQGTPGAAYRYNGFLFGLLTQVIEKASGESFEKLLVDKIIEPLGMSDTAPNASEQRKGEVLKARAKPYRVDRRGNSSLAEYPRGVNAAAGMVSTVLDLAKFDIAMDQNLLVTESSKKAMFTPTISNSGQVLPYGMGWFVQEHEGMKLVWHYGHQPNSYSSLILKIPKKQLTLILLANSDGASAPFNLGAGNVLESPFALSFIKLYAESR